MPLVLHRSGTTINTEAERGASGKWAGGRTNVKSLTGRAGVLAAAAAAGKADQQLRAFSVPYRPLCGGMDPHGIKEIVEIELEGDRRAMRHKDALFSSEPAGSARAKRKVEESQEHEAQREGEEEEDVDDQEGKQAGQPGDELIGSLLFGPGLRRCKGHDQSENGFYSLKSRIDDSEERVQAVQKQVPNRVYGLDYTLDVLTWMLPDRKNYPVVKPDAKERDKDRDAERPGPGAAQDALDALARRRRDKNCKPGAWGPAKVPQGYKPTCYIGSSGDDLLHRQRQLPIKLESLQQFVDGSGIHLLDDGASRGKKNYGKAMKELQKKLDKRGANESVGEEVLRMKAKEGYELARVLVERQQDADRSQQQRAAEQAPEQRADALQDPYEMDPYEKAVWLMKPGPDVNPVAKLRETLVKYEDSRTQRRQQMVEIMLAMDLDRLPDLVRRGKHLRVGASSTCKESLERMRIGGEMELLKKYTGSDTATTAAKQAQYLLYKEMMSDDRVKSLKRDLPPVVEYIFDFMQTVLQYGEVVTDEMFFKMVAEVDLDEFKHESVSRTVETLAGRVDGVGLRGLKDWFLEKHGFCPPGLLEEKLKQ